MMSHPLTFLVGYVLVTFAVSFIAVGPLAVFALTIFRRRSEKRYAEGFYLGASATAFAFMILHYALYLRGYGITKWSKLITDIFYPSRYF